ELAICCIYSVVFKPKLLLIHKTLIVLLPTSPCQSEAQSKSPLDLYLIILQALLPLFWADPYTTQSCTDHKVSSFLFNLYLDTDIAHPSLKGLLITSELTM